MTMVRQGLMFVRCHLVALILVKVPPSIEDFPKRLIGARFPE